MNYTEDEEIIAQATQYAKDNRKRITTEVTEKFTSEEIPVSIFIQEQT